MPAIQNPLQQLQSPRIWTVLFLGFSSGLPAVLTGSTLSAWFTESGISLMAIGALTLVGQPYVYKFLWAPFMDRFIPPFLGRRRGWMLIWQLCLIITIAMMALLTPQKHAGLMGMVALLIAFCSASQDTAINAYQTDVLQQEERGMGAALMANGWRIGTIVSGAFALIMAQRLGWHITYLIMAACMLVGLITTLLCPATPNEKHVQPASLKDAVIDPFKEFFSRHGARFAIILLAIIVFYKLGDAFALSLNTTFLLRGMHFSLTDVGVANKMVGLAASISGGLIGGLIMLRISLLRALILFGILQAVSNLGYMWLALAGHNYPLFYGAVAVEFFTSGLGTTAFLAFIMSLCHPKFTATQFALLTAISAVGRVYIGPAAAETVLHIGWAGFFFASFWVGLIGLGLIWFIRKNLM